MNKIRKISFKGHPILGNLSLDFCDKQGNAVDTIIIAGENGTGKSTILDCLYKVSSGTVNFNAGIEIENDLGKRKMLYWLDQNGNCFLRPNLTGVIQNFHVSVTNQIDFFKTNPLYGIFSDVDINFHAGDINYVTSQNIDMKKESRRSNTNLTQQINQLLIDVQALDDADYSKAIRTAKANGQDLNELVVPERMVRFKSAFSTMFKDMNYDRIDNKDGHKIIIFKKDGIDIPIEALSSGEKQIVYRGCFLLKDVNALNGTLVFIDEPEISLHPNWQKKIMGYYKKIFTNGNGIQTSQIFAVTHSPFIINNEKRHNDKVIVVDRDEQGNIVVKDKPEYYNCQSLELVQDAFFIKDFTTGQPTVYLEGRTDEKYFSKALEVFGYENVPFKFKWVGHIDADGQERFTGYKSLNQAFDFLVSQNLNYKNVLLYDCDTNKPYAVQNNVVTLCMSKYLNTKGLNVGIENALDIDDSIELGKFKKTTKKVDEYGCITTIQKLDKLELCEYICSLDNIILKKVFVHLKETIDRLLLLYRS